MLGRLGPAQHHIHAARGAARRGAEGGRRGRADAAEGRMPRKAEVDVPTGRLEPAWSHIHTVPAARKGGAVSGRGGAASRGRRKPPAGVAGGFVVAGGARGGG